MIRRLVLLLAAFAVLEVTGCALLSIATYPLKVLFNIVTGVGSSVGSFVGISYAVPIDGPPAVAHEVAPGRFVVDGLSRDVPCRIECSAPGSVSRFFEWPGDFAGSGEEVSVVLEASKR